MRFPGVKLRSGHLGVALMWIKLTATPTGWQAVAVEAPPGRLRQTTDLDRLFGGRTRARTWDPLIKSQLLYQLSYAP